MTEIIILSLNSKESFHKELIRKSFHLIPAFIAPIAYWILYKLFGFRISLFIGVCLIGIFAFLFSLHEIGLKKGFAHKVPIIDYVYNTMKRENEENNNIFTGGWVYFSTVFLLATITHPFAALMGFSLSAFGDAAAALIGGKIGRHRHFHSKRKTWEGTIAFVLIGIIYSIILYYIVGSLFNFGFSFNKAIGLLIIISFLGAIAETVPGQWYWDQFSVPLTIGLATQILFNLQWIPIIYHY